MMKLIKNHIYIFAFLFVGFIFSGCDEELSTRAPEKPIPNGFYFINSSPQGARIFLDGRNTGYSTPDTLIWMEHREYEVTLKMEYYRDTTFFITIFENEVNDTLIDYNSNPQMLGGVSFISTPSGAEIFLDGESTGERTPDTIRGLIPGKHIVDYKLLNYRSETFEVTVKSNQLTHAFMTLTDTSVWVQYSENTSAIPTNYLTDIYMDKSNKIWLGTDDKGIVRFDGISWEIFDESNSVIPFAKINKIDGFNSKICYATSAGLVVNNNSTWQIFNESNSDIISNDLTSVKLENENKIWIGSTAGLSLLENDQWENFSPQSSGLISNFIYAIEIDLNGVLWLSTGVGIETFVNREWNTILNSTSNGFYNYAVNSIAASSTNEIWFGHEGINLSTGGLTLYQNGNLSTYDLIVEGDVFDVFIDSSNRKWLSTNLGVLYFENPGSQRKYDNGNSGLKVNNVSAIIEASNGHFWIATYGGGLFKFKGN